MRVGGDVGPYRSGRAGGEARRPPPSSRWDHNKAWRRVEGSGARLVLPPPDRDALTWRPTPGIDGPSLSLVRVP